VTQFEALFWTYAIELPVTLLAAWAWRQSWKRALLAGLLASGLTHPIAWNLAFAIPTRSLVWGWYLIEAGVAAVETAVLSVLLLPSLPARADLVFGPSGVLVDRTNGGEYDMADQYCASKRKHEPCEIPGSIFESKSRPVLECLPDHPAPLLLAPSQPPAR
jgi:hypothetical protein